MPAPKLKIPAVCRYCGKVRYVPPSLGDRPFCNRECFRAWIRLPRNFTHITKNRSNTSGSNNGNWVPCIDILCANCGNVLSLKPRQVKKRNFCNNGKCYKEWLHSTVSPKQPNTQCSACGKPIYRPPHKFKRSKYFFCNPKCHGEWDSKHKIGPNSGNWQGGPIVVKCVMCDREYEKPICHARRVQFNLCSEDCKRQYWSQLFSDEGNPNWQGGITFPNYGKNWQEQRQRTRKRDNHTCQRCNITRDELGQELDVHHIVPFKYFITLYDGDIQPAAEEANKLPNLICYCPSCHATIERRRIT